MGAIASVLQWHCGECSLINPTEEVTCVRCKCVRHYRQTGIDDDRLCPPVDSHLDGHDTGTDIVSSMAGTCHLFGCTVIRRVRSKDTPTSAWASSKRGFSTATLVRNTAFLTASTLLLITQKRAHPGFRQWASVPCLRRLYRCEACLVLFASAGNPCVLCNGRTDPDDGTATMMMVNVCKNCQSGGCGGGGSGAVAGGGGQAMVPVEQPSGAVRNGTSKYTLLQPRVQSTANSCTSCQQQRGGGTGNNNKGTFLALNNIHSYSCSIAEKALEAERERLPGTVITTASDIRTTASGINHNYNHSQHSNSRLSSRSPSVWQRNSTGLDPGSVTQSTPAQTWNCGRCTLLNSWASAVCEACEAPRLHCNKAQQLPVVYRRSFSELSSQVLLNRSLSADTDNDMDAHQQSHAQQPCNRHSYTGPSVGATLTPPPTSATAAHLLLGDLNRRFSALNTIKSTMDDISAAPGQPPTSAAGTVYTYIGISEPRDSLYENQQVILSVNQQQQQQQQGKGGNNNWCLKERRWTCGNCSFAYNSLVAERCEVCCSPRSQPTTITVTAAAAVDDDVNSLPTSSDCWNGSTTTSSSDLSDRLQSATADRLRSDSELDEAEVWTCRKCTLVNSGPALACVACGGSKLKSLLRGPGVDLTLRRGEFWTCAKCTLRNGLVQRCCTACKAPRSPRSPSPRPHHHHQHQQHLSAATTTDVVITSGAGSGLPPPPPAAPSIATASNATYAKVNYAQKARNKAANRAVAAAAKSDKDGQEKSE